VDYRIISNTFGVIKEESIMQGKKHDPTDGNRAMVKTMAAVGTKHEDIAFKLEISADTLTKYYRKELDDGRIDANAAIARSLFDTARSGNLTAQMFWLKTRAGWKETDRKEIDGTIHLSWDEWVDDGNN
tara:strand:+ start:1376 stop:1762 length:387 start_codon:yes stop_codon:yes gene_type:complete